MLNESEEENFEANLVSQALPVAKLPENVDLTIAPTTGEDYLSRVRLEASKNEVVIAKNIDLKKFEKNRTAQFFQSDIVNETRKEFKASYQWQCEKSIEFSQLRDRVRKEKESFLKNNVSNNNRKKQLQSLKSKKDWYSFCFGTQSTKKFPNNNDTESSENNTGTEPYLSILYNLDQSKIVQIFDYHVEWLTSNGYSKKAFEWIYALMCFLEKPLIPETHSSLRQLARECISIRSKLTDVADEKLMEFNLFIALIGRYFQQNDLADHEE